VAVQMSNSVVFYSLAGIAVLSAALMITRRKAMHSAAFLTITLLATAGIFLQLQSRILFATQILFFAGVVVALFVAVMNRLDIDGAAGKTQFLRKIATLPLIFVVLGGESALMIWSVRKTPVARLLAFGATTAAKIAPDARAVIRSLFGSYQLAFAIAVVLLMVAAVGALVMTKQKVESGDALD
jgi:NADH-quinone oxidoreductase subunit J